MATGIFIMSWNITTFILFSRHFRFLATTTKPFLKYCINNTILPLIFLVFYFIKAVQFNVSRELLSAMPIFYLVAGFLSGFFFIVIVSMLYFFRADKSIIRRMTPVISNPRLFKSQFRKRRGETEREPPYARTLVSQLFPDDPQDKGRGALQQRFY
ncbi:hypothetical protein ACQ86N_43855 [Puia sp. P3]|uniref:hypothetical protein n=1 Tax=Puia sp. P3 TaxID=3423952 RepID=UPI003D67D44C